MHSFNKKIAECIEDHVFLVYGVPDRIVLDNCVHFISANFAILVSKSSVKIKYVALYNSQSEPVKRVQSAMRTAYVSDSQRHWDKFLPKDICAIRCSKHEVTHVTPNLINFGEKSE